MVAGGLVGAVGIWLTVTGGVAGAFLVLVGIGVLLLGAFFDRVESWSFGLQGIAAKVFDRPHGRELMEAAAHAPESALEAVLPVLREDVASDVFPLPSAFDGKRLTDSELEFIRQELYVTVFAVLRPGDEKWSAGGRVSDTVLSTGTRIAVVGQRADIDLLRRRLGIPNA
jgi:hypothetical protein